MSPNTLKNYIGKYIIKVSQDFTDKKPFFDDNPVRVGKGPSRIVKYDGVYILVRPLQKEDFDNFEFIKSLASNWTLKSLNHFLVNCQIEHSF